MGFFDFGRRKLPPLLKCVVCQRKPGETDHYHIPLCRSCKKSLHRDIHQHGGAIVENVAVLRQREGHDDAAKNLTSDIMHHASKLVPYEALRIQTIVPEPTVILHLMRAGDYHDLVPELRLDNYN